MMARLCGTANPARPWHGGDWPEKDSLYKSFISRFSVIYKGRYYLSESDKVPKMVFLAVSDLKIIFCNSIPQLFAKCL